MSLETWLEEFVPISSEETPQRAALLHSLKKWKGFRHDNLAKHGVAHKPISCYIVQIDTPYKMYSVSSRNCALCAWYECRKSEDNLPACPLSVVLGSPCDGPNRPYGLWVYNGDPEPMIEALQKTVLQQ